MAQRVACQFLNKDIRVFGTNVSAFVLNVGVYPTVEFGDIYDIELKL